MDRILAPGADPALVREDAGRATRRRSAVRPDATGHLFRLVVR